MGGVFSSDESEPEPITVSLSAEQAEQAQQIQAQQTLEAQTLETQAQAQQAQTLETLETLETQTQAQQTQAQQAQAQQAQAQQTQVQAQQTQAQQTQVQAQQTQAQQTQAQQAQAQKTQALAAGQPIAVPIPIVIPDEFKALDYGKIPFASFWFTMLARFAYLRPRDFLNIYTVVFGDKGKPNSIIPEALIRLVYNQANNNIKEIINDSLIFGNLTEAERKIIPTFLETKTKTYEAEGYKDPNEITSFPWAIFLEKINQALGEEMRADKEKKKGLGSFFKKFVPDMLTTGDDPKNCSINYGLSPEPNNALVFVSIHDTNYGSVYVLADKRFPHLITVSFRGTSNINDALTYLDLSTLTPTLIKYDGINEEVLVLYGIYKTLNDIMNCIMCAIEYVVLECNGVTSIADLEADSIKLATTGHSLGGALASFFAFKYIFSSEYRSGKPYLNKDIFCNAVASPQVFGEKAAAIFACVIQKNADIISNYKTQIETDGNLSFIKDTLAKIIDYDNIGRITFINEITENDPVTLFALPGYFRAGQWLQLQSFLARVKKEKLADYKTLGDLVYLDETTDMENCLIMLDSGFGTRCVRTDLTLVNVASPLENPSCVDLKRANAAFPIKMGKFFLNRMAYHTQYLGIAFGKAFQINLKFGTLRENITVDNGRPAEKLFLQKGAPLVRLIFYPARIADSEKKNKLANIIFYTLNTVRSTRFDDAAYQQKLHDKEAKEEADRMALEAIETVDQPSAVSAVPAVPAAPAVPAVPAVPAAPAPAEVHSTLEGSLTEKDIKTAAQIEAVYKAQQNPSSGTSSTDIIPASNKGIRDTLNGIIQDIIKSIDFKPVITVPEDTKVVDVFKQSILFIDTHEREDFAIYDILNSEAPTADHTPQIAPHKLQAEFDAQAKKDETERLKEQTEAIKIVKAAISANADPTTKAEMDEAVKELEEHSAETFAENEKEAKIFEEKAAADLSAERKEEAAEAQTAENIELTLGALPPTENVVVDENNIYYKLIEALNSFHVIPVPAAPAALAPAVPAPAVPAGGSAYKKAKRTTKRKQNKSHQNKSHQNKSHPKKTLKKLRKKMYKTTLKKRYKKSAKKRTEKNKITL